MPLFRTFILRRLASEPLRAALTIAGVALGIAVVVGIRLANQSSVTGFAAALDAMAGAASLEIVGPAGGLDELRLADLAWLERYGPMSPVIEGDALARRPGREAEAVRVLGVDILSERPFRQYELVERSGEAGQPRPQELLRLLSDPDSVILTAAFAGRHGIDVGESIELDIGDRRERMIVRALLEARGPARVLDGNFVLMDISGAQVAFDRLGRLDRVDVRLYDDRHVADVERVIASRLPPGLSVQRPARRGEQVETMLRAFHFNLTALAWVALLVGLFLVYNTVAVSVIARREEIGTLRALGTPRGTVLALFLGEAVVLGGLGSILGSAGGWLVAHAAVRLTSTTVNTLYVATSPTVPPLSWSHAGIAVAAGVILSAVAAAAPALEAGRVTPLDALRATSLIQARYRVRLRHIAAGLLLALAGIGLCQLGPVGGLPVFGFAAAVAIVFALACLVPPALFVFSRIGGRPLGRLFGIEGALAHASLSGAIPRLTVSIAALAVALSMMVAIAVMIASFRTTVEYWVGQTLQADLYISTARRSNLATQATISPELERAVTMHPDVAAVDRFRSVSLEYDGRLTVLGAGDFAVMARFGHLLFKEPRDGAGALESAIGRDAVIVSEAFALKAHVHAGDRIRLATRAGPAPFTIAAVYYDYSTDRGIVAMDRRTFARHYGDLRPTSLTVYLKAGADSGRTRESLMRELGERHRVFIHTNGSLRAEVLRIFDATFAVTYALEAIAILVGILGVSGTLLTLILERRQEIASLRLVGAGRSQVRKMVVIEAGLIGLVSQALGVLAGLGLALILIYVINVQSFGWTIQFHLPVAFLIQSSVALFLATALAGMLPARMAAAVAPIEQPGE